MAKFDIYTAAVEVQLQFKTPHKIKKHFAEEFDDEFTLYSILTD